MSAVKVPREKKGEVKLYTLSTCGWCHKTKQFLDDLGIEYSYVDVDLLKGHERESILKEMRDWNPRCSFPTLVFNNKTCIVGFHEEEIKEAIEK